MLRAFSRFINFDVWRREELANSSAEEKKSYRKTQGALQNCIREWSNPQPSNFQHSQFHKMCGIFYSLHPSSRKTDVVCINRFGQVNQTLQTSEALGPELQIKLSTKPDVTWANGDHSLVIKPVFCIKSSLILFLAFPTKGFPVTDDVKLLSLKPWIGATKQSRQYWLRWSGTQWFDSATLLIPRPLYGLVGSRAKKGTIFPPQM